jgi:hypothetical protein
MHNAGIYPGVVIPVVVSGVVVGSVGGLLLTRRSGTLRRAGYGKARSAGIFVAVCVSARERDARYNRSGVAATFFGNAYGLTFRGLPENAIGVAGT